MGDIFWAHPLAMEALMALLPRIHLCRGCSSFGWQRLNKYQRFWGKALRYSTLLLAWLPA
ncbi:hypothetical protein VS883_27525 [Escherichia coli]